MTRRLCRYPMLAFALVVYVNVVSGQDRTLVPLRNPFKLPIPQRPLARPSVADPAQQEPLILQLRATLVSEKDPLAVVGGRILAVGDRIQGYRLVTIREGEAVFSGESGRLTLKVGVDEADDHAD